MRKKSEIEIIYETYLLFTGSALPINATPKEKGLFYNKLRAQAKRTLEAYKVRGQNLDDVLQDLSKLDAEARSFHFTYAIDTLNKYTFKT